jgi:hypothetical protein
MLLLTAIGLTLPIYYSGMPAGNDLPQHYRFIYTFYDAVRSGDLYPSWPGETNLGFGDIGIRFYPPLAYYVVILFRSLIESWTTALAAAICFWFFVGGLGTYLLARESFSEKAALAGAVVFMAMPYHVNQVYNAGLFAEFAGLAILPFCFLFVRRVVLSGKIADVAGLAVSFALLILTHLPIVIIGSIGLAVYALALLRRDNALGGILKLGSGLTAALAMSAFYWVRMVSELGLVSHTLPQFTERKYDFHQNFLAAIFYVPMADYGETSLWFTDLLFAITLAIFIPAVVVLYLARPRAERNSTLPLLVVLGATVFLATPLSLPLWNNLPLLGKIQFPWRFLGLIVLVGTLLVAASFDDLVTAFGTKLRPIALIAAGLIIAGLVFTATQVIRPATFTSRSEFDNGFEYYRDDQSYECWWPVSAKQSALNDRERASAAERSIEVTRWTNGAREFQVGTGSGTSIRVATFYYPFWKATGAGTTLEVHPADDGSIMVDVPPGQANVILTFVRPDYEIYSRYVSIAAWLLVLIVTVSSFVGRRRSSLA